MIAGLYYTLPILRTYPMRGIGSWLCMPFLLSCACSCPMPLSLPLKLSCFCPSLFVPGLVLLLQPVHCHCPCHHPKGSCPFSCILAFALPCSPCPCPHPCPFPFTTYAPEFRCPALFHAVPVSLLSMHRQMAVSWYGHLLQVGPHNWTLGGPTSCLRVALPPWAPQYLQ